MASMSPPSGVNVPATAPPLREPTHDQVVPRGSMLFLIAYAPLRYTEAVVTGRAVQPAETVNTSLWLTATAVNMSDPYCSGVTFPRVTLVLPMGTSATVFVVVGRVMPSKAHTATFRLPVVPVSVAVMVDETASALDATQYHTEPVALLVSLSASFCQVLLAESVTVETTWPLPCRIARTRNCPTGTAAVVVIVDVAEPPAESNCSPTLPTKRTLTVPPHKRHSPTQLSPCRR